MTKDSIIENLNLEKLEDVGGYLKQAYRSELPIEKSTFSAQFKADRYVASISNHYLLGGDDTTKFHAIPSDKIWHFNGASENDIYVLIVIVSPDGQGELVKLGLNLEESQKPQVTIKGGYMMGAFILKDGVDKDYVVRNNAWVLMSVTAAPSLEDGDLVVGDAKQIAQSCPSLSDIILGRFL